MATAIDMAAMRRAEVARMRAEARLQAEAAAVAADSPLTLAGISLGEAHRVAGLADVW